MCVMMLEQKYRHTRNRDGAWNPRDHTGQALANIYFEDEPGQAIDG